MQKMVKQKCLLATWLAVCISLFAWPSVEGKIDGVVRDTSGNPLENVKVTITSQKTASIRFELSTNKEGKFLQIGIWPGYYIVDFKKDGFMPVSKEVKVLILGEIKMEVKLERVEEAAVRSISEADRLFLKGNKFYEEKNYEEAVVAYLEAIKLNEKQWAYYLNLGLAFKKIDKKEEARAAFQKAAELNPQSYSANKELGENLAKSGNFEEAKKYYQKSFEVSPDDPDAAYNLAVCLTNSGDSDAALMLFLKTTELNKDYADAYFQIGTIYIKENNVKEAIDHLEKFLKLAPDHEKANLARQLLEYLKK